MKARSASTVSAWVLVLAGLTSATPVIDAGRAVYRDAVLSPDPEAGVVALAIRFPVGSAQDPRGSEGTAFLLGRVLERRGNQALSPHGATVRIDVAPQEFLIRLLALPDRWSDAVEELEALVYQGSFFPADVELARAEMLDILTFEAGAPVRIFEAERVSFLLGPLHPAARPTLGTAGSLAAVDLPAIEAFRSLHLRPESGILAATGPIGARELAEVLGTTVRDLRGDAPITPVEDAPNAPGAAAVAVADSLTDAPAGGGLAEAAPLPPRPDLRLDRAAAPLEAPSVPLGPPAWTTPERSMVDRPLTSTWISVAFPFPRGTPHVLLDFLGHVVVEALTPSPPDPGLYEARVSTTEIQDAPVLVVTASVDPTATSRWEDRLRGSVGQVAEEPPLGAFFDLARRRFRSALVLELAVPENRAAWLVRRVASGEDAAADPDGDVWRIRRSAVADLAAMAGPPRTLVFGPGEMAGR